MVKTKKNTESFRHVALDPYKSSAEDENEDKGEEAFDEFAEVWTEDDQEWWEEWHKEVEASNPGNDAVCGRPIRLEHRIKAATAHTPGRKSTKETTVEVASPSRRQPTASKKTTAQRPRKGG